MPVLNYYETMPKKYLQKSNYHNPHEKQGMLVHPYRVGIIGGTGSFKTNTLMNIIKQSDCFERFYLIAKDTDEPLYSWLTDDLIAVGDKMGIELITIGNDIDDVPSLTEIDDTVQNLIIIDDMIVENLVKAKKLNEMMTRGRKKNCSVVLISQTYFNLPKLIRLNFSYLILKKIESVQDIKLILMNYPIHQTIKEVMDLYTKSTVGVHFFLIDMKATDPKMKLRMDFDTPLLN